MLKEIRIKNFRGFDELEISNFKKINLFVGKNSGGKTSVLEALFLALKPYSNSLYELYKGRGLPMNHVIRQTSQPQQNQPQKPQQDQPQIQIQQFASPTWSAIFGFLKNNGNQKQNTSIEVESEFGHLELKRTVILKPYFFSSEKLNQSQESFEFIEKSQNQTHENSDFFYISSVDENLRNNSEKSYFSTGIPKLKEVPDCADVSQNGFSDSQAKLAKDSKINYPTFKIFFHLTGVANDLSLGARFEKIRDSEFSEKLVNLMQKIDDKIREFRFDNKGSIEVVIEVEGKKHALPFGLLGDGAKKIFSILCSIPSCKNGVLLIDEIENGIHHTSQKLFWDFAIATAKEFNVQIFATTHSYEAIEALDKSYKETCELKGKTLEEDDEIRLYRVNKTQKSPTKFDSTQIDKFIEQEWEVR